MFSRVLFAMTFFASCLACSKADDSNDANDSATLSSFEISKALILTPPESVIRKNPTLSLAAGPKSYEACDVRNQITSELAFLDFLSEELCPFESDPRIKIGTKYAVTIGQKAYAFWAEETSDALLKIQICLDGKLQKTFFDWSKNETGIRGKVVYKVDEVTGSSAGIHHSTTFNHGYSTPGKSMIYSTSAIESSDNKRKTRAALRFEAGAVSDLRISLDYSYVKEGTTYGGISSAASKIDDEFGMTFYTSKRVNDEAGESRLAFFNAVGEVVSQGDSEKFTEGGRLSVGLAEVPANIESDFAVPAFPEGSWDCSGTSETLVIDPEDSSQKFCKVEVRASEACDDAGHASGAEVDHAAPTGPTTELEAGIFGEGA